MGDGSSARDFANFRKEVYNKNGNLKNKAIWSTNDSNTMEEADNAEGGTNVSEFENTLYLFVTP